MITQPRSMPAIVMGSYHINYNLWEFINPLNSLEVRSSVCTIFTCSHSLPYSSIQCVCIYWIRVPNLSRGGMIQNTGLEFDLLACIQRAKLIIDNMKDQQPNVPTLEFYRLYTKFNRFHKINIKWHSIPFYIFRVFGVHPINFHRPIYTHIKCAG